MYTMGPCACHANVVSPRRRRGPGPGPETIRLAELEVEEKAVLQEVLSLDRPELSFFKAAGGFLKKTGFGVPHSTISEWVFPSILG